MKYTKIILILLLFFLLVLDVFSQKITIDKLYESIKLKNIENYKKLFSDTSYNISGRRLSIVRNNDITNIKVNEIKSDQKNDRCYTIFNLIYDNKAYPKNNNTLLLALLYKNGNEWQIVEICDNSDNKGELYINKKIDKYYNISKLGHDYRSDSLGVSLTLELETDKHAFDKKYKIFENNYWLKVVWKDLNINIDELTYDMTYTYYDSNIRRGFIEFRFSKEKDAIFLGSCLYFKINTNNNIEFYFTDGQKNENNLFK